MSISTPDGEQRSANVVTVGGKAPKGGQKPGQKPGQKAVAAASKASAAATKSSSAKGAGPKKPTIQPVKVNQGRNWGPIALIAAVVLLAAGIIGFAAWNAFPASWESKAADIEGIQITKGREDPAILPASHSYDKQTYTQLPPVGGNHHDIYQSCMGNVYSAPIPNEHAVHSLEHGAVWITYQESLPSDQVEKLAAKVNGQAFSMMSPYKDLDKPISLQAWGYQLKVDSADDPRIDEFITALRQNASIEPGVACSGGNTATGTTPLTQQQAVEKGLIQQ